MQCAWREERGGLGRGDRVGLYGDEKWAKLGPPAAKQSTEHPHMHTWTRRHATGLCVPWEDDGLLPAQTAPDCSDCTDCTIRAGGSHPFRAGKPPTQTAKRGSTTSKPGVTWCEWA
jgi:hypothetical protein